ncbi:glycosyltransferase [Candidatus Dojkabacteria bacterium]|nr:glycosyltransferase [Candidatus Dojkabacteria bacterium]
MKSPLISIVIPSYNKVKYIEKTLQSIVSQKNANFEVIIQDGGSTDGTLNVIKKYAKKYPSLIRYESKKDGGQLDAINKGLLKAKGDIVTFINADDVYEDDAFESVVGHYIENPDALWFAGKCKIVNDKDQEIAKFWTICKNTLLRLNSHFLLLLTSNYMSQPSIFLTKKAYQKYGPFSGNKKFVYEYDTWLTLGKVVMPVVINKYLSKFRISEDNISSVVYNDLFDMDIKVVKKHSKNKIFIIVHMLNNYLRVIIRKLM